MGYRNPLHPELYEEPSTVAHPSVELVFQNESGMGYDKAFVAVMVNGVQHDKVWAYIDREQGADGGWYPVIKFRR
jgi:hypothetical protein